MLVLFCEVVKDQMRDERRHVVTFLDGVAYSAGKSDTPSWVSDNQFATTDFFQVIEPGRRALTQIVTSPVLKLTLPVIRLTRSYSLDEQSTAHALCQEVFKTDLARHGEAGS